MIYKSILFKKHNIVFLGRPPESEQDSGIKEFKPLSFVSTKELESNKFYIVMVNDDPLNYDIINLDEIPLFDIRGESVNIENVDDDALLHTANNSLKHFTEVTIYH